MISTTPNGEKATELAKMVVDGHLKVIVDDVVDFEDVLQVGLEFSSIQRLEHSLLGKGV